MLQAPADVAYSFHKECKAELNKPQSLRRFVEEFQNTLTWDNFLHGNSPTKVFFILFVVAIRSDQ